MKPSAKRIPTTPEPQPQKSSPIQIKATREQKIQKLADTRLHIKRLQHLERLLVDDLEGL